MPTDYQDDDSVNRYMETCGKINALITDCDIAEIIIIGDFNCSAGSRMYTSFNDLLEANKLVCGDIKRLSNVFTYSNSDHSRFSWIDHILSTNLLDNTISDLQILYDYVLSDYKPVSVTFDDIVTTDSCAEQDSDDVIFTRHCWDKVDDVTMFHYTTYVDQMLQSIVVPRELQECLVTGGKCDNCIHQKMITEY